MRSVCLALSVSHSHVFAKKESSSDWTGRRKSHPRADDTQVKRAIADVVHNTATEGCGRDLG